MGVFVLTESQGLVALTPSEFVREDDFQQLLENIPRCFPAASRNHIGATLAPDQARDGGSRRGRRFRPMVARPPFRRSGGRADFGGGKAAERYPATTRGGGSDVGLRGQCRRVSAGGASARRIRTGLYRKGSAPEEVIRDRLTIDTDPEALWQQVKTNLQAGRIRMLFVADKIPAELRRIVEFLNEQMNPAEVLALELRQFQGEASRRLCRRFMVRPKGAQRKNRARHCGNGMKHRSAPTSNVGMVRYFTHRTKNSGWIKTNTDEPFYGRGSKDGSVGLVVIAHGLRSSPLFLWTYGTVEIAFPYMKKPFDDAAKREELRGSSTKSKALTCREMRFQSGPAFPSRSHSRPTNG